MTDRPILFSAPMVRSLLAGAKTQTRRVLKPQPPATHNLVGIYAPGLTAVFNPGNRDRIDRDDPGEDFPVRIRFMPGDRLWVREAWACHWATDDLKPREIPPDLWSVRYVADDYIRPAARDGSVASLDQCKQHRPSMFMPRWASRLTLIVNEVRVQRLQKISEEDAIAEGIVFDERKGFWVPGVEHPNKDFPYLSRTTAREMYAALWDTINGSGAWLGNPFVVAVSFSVHQQNIDAMKVAA